MDDENVSPIISGDVENIIIKLEPSEDFLHDEDSSTTEGVNLQSNEIDESPEKDFHQGLPDCNVCVEPDENPSTNIVQIPFYLENYFADDNDSNLHHVDSDHLACSCCKIIFPNEKMLHEHLILHIDINKMGCNVCDKDLNTAEKYQLHVMAITRQSIYFCDLCKKSCAGVVRSKDQTRYEGKAYACHDCEIQITGKPYILSGSIPNIQHNRKYSNCEPIFQSIRKTDGNIEIEIKLNGSKLNPNIFFHKCTYCDAFFAQSVTLSRHLRVRHNVTRDMMNALRNSKLAYEELKICNFQFVDNQKNILSEEQEIAMDLTMKSESEQLRTATSEKASFETKVSTNEFTCNERDTSYSENVNVNKHLREKHKKRRAKFTCKTCLKQFRLRRCYNSHLTFHENTKNYHCRTCELEFFTKYKLQQHMKIHNQEKKETVPRKKMYKSEKKMLTDQSQKRNLRRSRLRNS